MRKRRTSSAEADRDLLDRVSSGDLGVFSLIYDRYSQAAFSLALKVSGDPSLAEDVVQESFISVWRRPSSFDASRGSFSSYLLGIVHHKCVDAIRHEESLKRRSEAAGRMVDPAPAGVEEAAWMTMRRERVKAAVLRLSDVQREAMELAYFEGFTHSEVAEKLGIPLGTAKSRLRDGLIRLRVLLSQEVEEP